MKKYLLIALLFCGCENAIAQMALKGTAQIKEAIVALQEHGGWINLTSGQKDSYLVLADALSLSLRFNTGYVLNANESSMIKNAIDEKKAKEDYNNSEKGKRENYNREHPTYTRLDGSNFIIPKNADIGYSGNGYEELTEVYWTDKNKKIRQVTFKEIEPGIFKEVK